MRRLSINQKDEIEGEIHFLPVKIGFEGAAPTAAHFALHENGPTRTLFGRALAPIPARGDIEVRVLAERERGGERKAFDSLVFDRTAIAWRQSGEAELGLPNKMETLVAIAAALSEDL